MLKIADTPDEAYEICTKHAKDCFGTSGSTGYVSRIQNRTSSSTFWSSSGRGNIYNLYFRRIHFLCEISIPVESGSGFITSGEGYSTTGGGYSVSGIGSGAQFESTSRPENHEATAGSYSYGGEYTSRRTTEEEAEEITRRSITSGGGSIASSSRGIIDGIEGGISGSGGSISGQIGGISGGYSSGSSSFSSSGSETVGGIFDLKLNDFPIIVVKFVALHLHIFFFSCLLCKIPSFLKNIFLWTSMYRRSQLA